VPRDRAVDLGEPELGVRQQGRLAEDEPHPLAQQGQLGRRVVVHLHVGAADRREHRPGGIGGGQQVLESGDVPGEVSPDGVGLGRVVPEEGAPADPCRVRDLVAGHVLEAAEGEQVQCRPLDAHPGRLGRHRPGLGHPRIVPALPVAPVCH
jgi:hypothetical protein